MPCLIWQAVRRNWAAPRPFLHPTTGGSPRPRPSCLARRLLVDPNRYRLGRDTVRYHLQDAWTRLLCWRHVEMRRYDCIRGHRHAAMVVGAAVENVGCSQIPDPYQRVVRRPLYVIAIGSPLGHAIETGAFDFIGLASGEYVGCGEDDRCDSSLQFQIPLGDIGIVELNVA